MKFIQLSTTASLAIFATAPGVSAGGTSTSNKGYESSKERNSRGRNLKGLKGFPGEVRKGPGYNGRFDGMPKGSKGMPGEVRKGPGYNGGYNDYNYGYGYSGDNNNMYNGGNDEGYGEGYDGGNDEYGLPPYLFGALNAAAIAVQSESEELPECSTLGFSGSTEGCTTYCTDNGLEFSDYAQIGDLGTVTCMCTKDGTTTNVCIKPLAGPNTEGKPCTDFGITDNQSCTDYCNGFGEWDTTETGGKITSSSCTCGSIDGVTTKPFYCTSALGTSSSSALSLLLPGAVVTVTTYLITMGI